MRLDRIGAAFALWAWASVAFAAAADNEKPPAKWAAYIDAARAVDAVADDEARCVAHPDLPGNSWRPDAGKWRCAILRKPPFQLDEIDRLLGSEDCRAGLESRFAALLDAHYKDQNQREQIFLAFAPFDSSARAGEIAKRWLEQSPGSAFANAALATHHGAAGWEARGSRFVRETSDEQLERMSRKFALAIPLYLKALEIEPRLSPACTDLAAIGRQASDALQQYAMARCTKVDPDSYFLAIERISAAKPKWGGSDAQLRYAVAYAQARVDRNPMLAALLGESAGYRPANAEDEAAVADELAAAAKMGPSGSLSSLAGRGYSRRGDRWAALVYLSQSLRFWPRSAERRYERAGVLMSLGELEWARSDMRVALEQQPNDGWNQYRAGQIVAELEGVQNARPYFKRAMDYAESRKVAMAQYCSGFILQNMMMETDACTRDFVTEYPTDAEAWRQRAFHLSSVGSEEVDAAYDNFFRYADLNDEFQKAQVLQIRKWRESLKQGGSSK